MEQKETTKFLDILPGYEQATDDFTRQQILESFEPRAFRFRDSDEEDELEKEEPLLDHKDQ